MWSKKQLSDVCTIKKGSQVNRTALSHSGDYYVLNGGMEPSGYLDRYNTEANTISISEGGNSCGYVAYNTEPFWSGGHNYTLSELEIEKLYLYYFLKCNESKIMNLRVGSGLPNIQRKMVEAFPVYYPVDIKEQRCIATVLTSTDEAIAASRALVKKFTVVKQGLMQNLLVIGELTRLDKVCSYIIGGSTPNTHESKYWGGSNIWITPTDLSVLNSQYISNSERKLTDAGLKRATGKLVPANSIIISCRAPVGYCAVVTEPFSFNQGCKALVCKDVNPLFLYYQLSAAKNHLERFASGTTFLELPKKELERFRIHCPSLPEQQRIAEILTAADERLSAERERLRKLEDIKRGLMDDLLTNRVSTDQLQGGI